MLRTGKPSPGRARADTKKGTLRCRLPGRQIAHPDTGCAGWEQSTSSPASCPQREHMLQMPGEGHSRSSIPVISQESLPACTTCSPAASRVSSYLSFCSAPLKIVLPQVLFLSKARRFSPGPTQGTKCKEPPPCPLFTCLLPVFSCACSRRDNIG